MVVLERAGAEGLSSKDRGNLDQALQPGVPSTDSISPAGAVLALAAQSVHPGIWQFFKDNQPVWRKIAERLPITIQLNVVSIVLIYRWLSL